MAIPGMGKNVGRLASEHSSQTLLLVLALLVHTLERRGIHASLALRATSVLQSLDSALPQAQCWQQLQCALLLSQSMSVPCCLRLEEEFPA